MHKDLEGGKDLTGRNESCFQERPVGRGTNYCVGGASGGVHLDDHPFHDVRRLGVLPPTVDGSDVALTEAELSGRRSQFRKAVERVAAGESIEKP